MLGKQGDFSCWDFNRLVPSLAKWRGSSSERSAALSVMTVTILSTVTTFVTMSSIATIVFATVVVIFVYFVLIIGITIIVDLTLGIIIIVLVFVTSAFRTGTFRSASTLICAGASIYTAVAITWFAIMVAMTLIVTVMVFGRITE